MEFTTEQLNKIVSLWEELCGLHFVRAETQGYYTYSTRSLYPGGDHSHRMPNAEEIRALILSDGEEREYAPGNPWAYGETLYPITLTLMAYGDGYGTDYDAANVRALDGRPGVTSSTGYNGGSATVVVGEMSSFANAQGETPDPDEAIGHLAQLVSDMEYLASDSPCLDDGVHDAYIDDIADEMWDAYLRSDIRSELADLSADGEFYYDDVHVDGDSRDGDDIIREAYYDYEGNEWRADTAMSVVNDGHDQAVRHVAETVLGWDVDAIQAEREARQRDEHAARETFDVAWAEYRAQFPLPAFDSHADEYGNALFSIMQRDSELPATVDSIRLTVVEQSRVCAARYGK